MENEITEKPRKFYHEIKDELQSVAAATLVTSFFMALLIGISYVDNRYQLGIMDRPEQHRPVIPSHLETITATPEYNISE